MHYPPQICLIINQAHTQSRAPTNARGTHGRRAWLAPLLKLVRRAPTVPHGAHVGWHGTTKENAEKYNQQHLTSREHIGSGTGHLGPAMYVASHREEYVLRFYLPFDHAIQLMSS
jgi:hypothetical protein